MADTLGRLIQFKQGTRISLPELKIGEPGFCTDDKTFWIGSSTGNVQIALKTDTDIPNNSIPISKLDAVLQNRINNFISKTDIINNVTSTDTQKPLAANQGRLIDLKAGVYKNRYGFSNLGIQDSALSSTDFSNNITILYNSAGSFTNLRFYAYTGSMPNFARSVAKKILDDTGKTFSPDDGAGFTVEITFNHSNSVANKILIYPNNSDDVFYINYDNTVHKTREFFMRDSIAKGSITIVPTAPNTPTSSVISWNLSGVPTVSITPYTVTPSSTSVSYSDKSATGCTIWIERTISSQVAIDYIAIV